MNLHNKVKEITGNFQPRLNTATDMQGRHCTMREDKDGRIHQNSSYWCNLEIKEQPWVVLRI